MLETYFEKVRFGESLAEHEAAHAAQIMFDGDGTDQEIAEFLVALAEKGETAEEVAGFARELLHRATPVTAPKGTVDLCGTGGSELARFNVSTAAAFVVASCGAVVAKHGNRGSRRPNGTFDLLEVLGIPIDVPPDVVEECLERVGVAFIFAQTYHPGMKRVAQARKIAGRRTVFNLAGPLSNPARVTRQLVGTADPRRMGGIAAALQLLGRTKAVVVSGYPGIDEFSVAGESIWLQVAPDGIIESRLQPTDLGIRPIDYSTLPTGDCHHNAVVFRLLMDNQAPEGIRNMVALNAGAALFVGGQVRSIEDGYRDALDAIIDRRMKETFGRLKTLLDSKLRKGTA